MTNLVNDYFEGKEGTAYTVTCKGKTLTGMMYGNDECFDGNEFYQMLVADGRVYWCYYEIPDGCDDFSDIDYTMPYRIEDCTDRYID